MARYNLLFPRTQKPPLTPEEGQVSIPRSRFNPIDNVPIEVPRLFMVRLNFQKVKGLFLAEISPCFCLGPPIRYCQLGRVGLRAEYLPMIGDPDRYLRLR